MDKKYWILGSAVLALIIIGTLYFLSSRKTPETTQLTLVTYGEDEANLSSYIAAFEAANNTKINFKKIDPQNYELESLNLLSTNKVDIWGIPSNWIPKQHAKLAPYSDKLAISYQYLYQTIVSQENMVNDKIYGVPISLDTLVLFVNSDIKAKSQDLTPAEDEILSAEPKTWDDLAAKNPLLQSGGALGTANLAAAPDILTALMLQYGTQMTNQDNTQATFHTALNTLGEASFPGAAALDLYTSFAKNNKTTGDPLTAFADGKAAFYIDYSAKESDITRLNPSLNYSIKALPQIKASKAPINFASYETFTVPNTSKNQLLAWQFLIGLTNKDNLKAYLETSKKNPALLELENPSNVVDKSLETAQSWYNPEPTEVNKIFRDIITQVVSGQKAQTALDGAAVQVTNLLGKIEN